jgi:flagellar hook-length control protein FliK
VNIVTPPLPVVSPSALGQQPAPAAPAFQVGQVIDALVVALIDTGTVRLSLPGLVLDAKTTVPLSPGSTVRLAVQGSGSVLQLVIVGNAEGSAGPAPTIRGQPASGPLLSNGSQGPANTVSIGSPGPVDTLSIGSPGPLNTVSIGSQGPLNTASIGSQGLVNGGGVASTIAQATIVDVAGLRSAPTVEPAIASAGTGSQPMAQAVAGATQVAATRQGGLAPLLANVAQVVGSGSAPGPVLQAALDVLNLRVPLDERLVAADVKQALVQSGLFLEARLASTIVRGSDAAATASGPTSGPASGPTIARGAPGAVANLADIVPPASGDLKAALLVFREVVTVWLDLANAQTGAGTPTGPTLPTAVGVPRAADGTAKVLPGLVVADGLAKALPESAVAATADPPRAPGPPPPYHGDSPSAQAVAAPTIAADAPPAEIAQQLLSQTDAALARHTLMQVASLPDQAHAAAGPRTDAPGPQWLFEIPFVTRQGTSLAQFEIGRDGRAVTADGRAIWRARFSLDVEPIGPVHVQVALLGERAAVTLWAEREASAAQLRDSAPMLSEALRRAELEPGEIQCRTGAPAAPRPAAGRFLDRAS